MKHTHTNKYGIWWECSTCNATENRLAPVTLQDLKDSAQDLRAEGVDTNNLYSLLISILVEKITYGGINGGTTDSAILKGSYYREHQVKVARKRVGDLDTDRFNHTLDRTLRKLRTSGYELTVEIKNLLIRVINPLKDLEDSSVDLNRSVWICEPAGARFTETIKPN